jgi:hypothetical protein
MLFSFHCITSLDFVSWILQNTFDWNLLNATPYFTVHVRRRLAACLTYSSTPVMEEVSSTETLVYSYRTTRHQIPQNTTLHIKCSEISLKRVFMGGCMYQAMKVCENHTNQSGQLLTADWMTGVRFPTKPGLFSPRPRSGRLSGLLSLFKEGAFIYCRTSSSLKLCT